MRKRLTHEERKQETRKRLLESAADTFAKLGFHGASVDKIAEEAGFTKGAVYTHFKSKEELFLALFEQKIDSHLTTIHHIVEQENSLDHVINKLEHYFDLDRQNNKAWGILNMEFLLYAMRNDSVREKWSNVILKSVEHITKVIRIIREENGDTFDLSSEELAWTILSLENGIGIFQYISGSHVPANLYGKSLQSLFKS
ncbi:TetR/AcrR family transcriptional regulator [Bacillus sp. JCM 19034]|uniref:TetR/AcrR family transcriptional regulator n=1 Tax=Bacillus sp. JCM 19034 TaxID=1481928 RepID=UPI0007837B8F|nr:TetR/AcrR family transcriptional regulator [Bacillus sp. JCM 19034]